MSITTKDVVVFLFAAERLGDIEMSTATKVSNTCNKLEEQSKTANLFQSCYFLLRSLGANPTKIY